jgi:hypothetical protein
MNTYSFNLPNTEESAIQSLTHRIRQARRDLTEHREKGGG